MLLLQSENILILNLFFFIEYDIDISSVPDSILVIPFLANILPIAWVLDEEIVISEIDAEFYNSIHKFKSGYINMYPMLNFRGSIKCRNIVKNNFVNINNSSRMHPLCFFSGGVDSFNTLIRHIDEKPILLSIWGSDVNFDDFEGWNNINKIIDSTVNLFNLKSHKIKSSFRYFLNTELLSYKVQKSGDGWWHGFQHGIGIISHAAPIAWLYKSKICYFASSYSKKDPVTLPCASYPTIDETLHFMETQVIHDGFEQFRQDKIDTIVKFKKEKKYNIKLHVCWQSQGGVNCNKCEKCLRTILGIIVAHGNPDEFGLHYIPSNMKYLMDELNKKSDNIQYLILLNNYFGTQIAFRNRNIIQKYPELMWFNKVNIKKNMLEAKDISLIKKVKNFIKAYTYKIFKLFM